MTALLIILLMLGLSDSALAADRGQAERKAQAEALFDEARSALNRSKYEDAARLFAQAYELSSPEMEAGDALYWEAFARSRLARTAELKRAVEVLRLQQEDYAGAATAAEGEALAARIYAQLAERGEADAAREITARASEEQIRQETRTAALQALMQMDPARAMPMLTKIVQDDRPENRELRRNAIFIMCREGGREAEDLLIGLLQKETDPEFLSEIVMCLSMSGSDRALQALMDLFRATDDPEVAQAALISIGQNGSEQVFAFLLEIARDSSRDAETRAQALMALGMTGRDKEVAQVLSKVLETETDPTLIQMALMSLSRLDDPSATAAILAVVTREDVSEETRATALHFATMNGGVPLDTLRQMYRSAHSREMKQQICHVLIRSEDQDGALDLLIEITRTETDPEIRRDAVFWIGQFDSDKAAQYLIEVINEQ
jgi:hypothetical protein